MNPIFYTAATSGEEAVPSFHPHQNVIGPHVSHKTTDGRRSSCRTFPGEFDLGTWFGGKGMDAGAPLTVIIDGNHLGWPVNLASHAGPKIMMVGHLPKSPVFRRELAAYVAEEPFDLIVLTHGPGGSDLFAVAGQAPVVIRPGWLSPSRAASRSWFRTSTRRAGVACDSTTASAGSVLHQVLAEMRAQDLEPQTWGGGLGGRRALFAKTAVSLMIPEDGDLPAEAWEALVAGSAVVVLDRAGHDWASELPMVVTHGCGVAVDEIRQILEDPKRGASLRNRAENWYEANLSLKVRRRDWTRMLERLHDVSILHEVLPRKSLGPEWNWPVSESGHPFLRVSPADGQIVLLALP